MKARIEINNKIILVMGCVGFVGAALVVSLLKGYCGIHVIGVDNLNYYNDVELKKYRLNLIDEELKKSEQGLNS